MENYEIRLLKEYCSGNSEKLAQCICRLESGEPVDYIIGESAFYGEMYNVSPDVLIPRFDTERVVDRIIEFLPNGGRLADLCCGSGCIGISSLCHSEGTSCLSVDISQRAIEIAKGNAERNKVTERIRFECRDIYELELPDSEFDIIASNPPYVRTSVCKELPKGCRHEPYIAFDGGEDGMVFYRLILSRFSSALKKEGKFIFEIGYDQADDIKDLAVCYGFDAKIYKDYSGNDRVALLSFSGENKE